MDCHDIGWVKKLVGPEAWRHEAVRCTCMHTEDMRARWERARKASNMTQALYACTFANYDTKSNTDAHYAVQSWAHGPGQRWLLMWGGYGTGKTHLLAAAFNVLVEEGVRTGLLPLYVLVPDLLDHVREGYQTGDYGDRFWSVRKTPILLLDDLGAEQRTGWSDQAMFMLLDYRYREQLPTLIASNLDPDRLEGRISSRLQDRALCQVFHMAGPDYRQTDARERQRGDTNAGH